MSFENHFSDTLYVSYRFAFNGKEKDNEVKGEGNQYDYGMRIYDPRIGKFLSRDPLSNSFPWNSPYSYAENDVIRSIDLDGLEKVVLFGGNDFKCEGVSKTTLQTAATIQKFSDDHNLNYDVKTYNVSLWNASEGTAAKWIMDNYKKDEPIIIYGYSKGGVAANQLAKLLDLNGVKVNLLVTVDPAFSIFGGPLEIPNNVQYAFNFYQTNASSIFSRGYPARYSDNTNKMPVFNADKTGKVPGLPQEAHGGMDEYTQNDATNLIKSEMLGKLDGIIDNVLHPKSESN